MWLTSGLSAGAQSLAPPPRREGLPPPARGYTVTRFDALTVEHMSVSAGAARQVSAVYARSAAAIEAELGLRVPAQPYAILAPTDDQFLRRFQDVTGYPAPGLVLAVAFPSRRLIIVRESGLQAGTGSSLEATLRHELVHLALGPLEQRRGERLPKWLNEGLSEWASGRRLTPQERNEVAGWAKADQLPLLDRLEGSFPAVDDGMARAYTISLAFLTWLEETHGEGTLRRLVAELQALQPLPEALAAATGLETAADLEPDWHASLHRDYSFWTGLIFGLDVWAVTAILCLIAIARHVVRNRRLKREMEAAEAGLVELPAPEGRVIPFPQVPGPGLEETEPGSDSGPKN